MPRKAKALLLESSERRLEARVRPQHPRDQPPTPVRAASRVRLTSDAACACDSEMKARGTRLGNRPFVESRALILAGVLLAAFLPTTSAHAEVSPTATARQLAIEGIDQVEAGNCQRGEPLLEGAEKLHHAPVHLQYLARCRARAGRLVAATELWRQIINEGAPPGSSPAVQAAVAEATTELTHTLPRLGGATIHATGNYPGLELSLDGSPLPNVVLGAKQVLDPGPHDLVARAPGYAPWTKRWALADGQTIDIPIALVRSDGQPEGPKLGGSTPERNARGGGLLSTTGWFVGATGVAAMTAGVVTWIRRNDKRSQLEHDCPQYTCRPPYTEETLTSAQSSIRDLTTTTNILMFGGGALVAGGVTMILLGASESRAPKVSPTAAKGSAGLVFSGQW